MLTIKSLHVNYGEKPVLKDLSLVIHPSEVTAVIGPNGSGKTTLIRAISGTLPILSGEITQNINSIINLSAGERAKVLAVVPQARQLAGGFDVKQTLLLGRTPYMNWLGMPSDMDLSIVHWAMQVTGIEDLADRKNAELSGGEQQRVFLARALVQKTPYLLLDEPTNHLDLEHQIQFLHLLRKLTKEENIGVLIAMHDLNMVSQIADKVLVLNRGETMVYGDLAEVLNEKIIENVFKTKVKRIVDEESGNSFFMPTNRI